MSSAHRAARPSRTRRCARTSRSPGSSRNRRCARKRRPARSRGPTGHERRKWRVEQAQLAAPAVHVTLLSPELRTLADLESAFVALTQDRPDALLVFVDPFTVSHRRRIVDFAAANRLPAIYEDRVFVDASGLMSYGPSIEDICRRAATYVDKILKGAKPGDLPIEQPTKFELIINLKTAKALGLEIPLQFHQLADEVIE
jgi:putative tryptophan/tyrosine transport system substrate-binding protein